MKRQLKVTCCIAGITTLFCIVGFLPRNGNQANKSQSDNLYSSNMQEPRITIEEKPISKQTIVYVTDSAASIAAISQKFMQIIPVELGGFFKKNDLKMAGAPCAWYNGNKAPFVFDIGVPANKAPAGTEGRIKIKEIAAGKAVVAHFYGPYNLTEKGYIAVEAWLKEHNKTATGAPYEVYLGDPGIEKDPYKILTDIVFPVE